jgi:hypothetical protein
MSLYNTLHGIESMAPVLLELLGNPVVPRFRDCYVGVVDGERIVIYTRTGGGNREGYEAENQALRTVPGFIRDYDDDFDSTFAYWVYEIPAEHRETLEQVSLPATPREKFDSLLEALRTGKDTPETKRANVVGKQIVDAINNGTKIIKV